MATVALGGFGFEAVGQVQPYRVICVAPDIGVPLGVNNHDEVVGYIIPSNNWSLLHAFLWSPAIGLQHLNNGSVAYDINDRGQIAGMQNLYDFTSGGVWETNHWTLIGAQEARAINNRGQVIGLICTQPVCAPLPYRGFLDNDVATPGYTQLLTPAPTEWSHALGINDLGEIVGNYYAYTAHVRQYYGLFYTASGDYEVLHDKRAYTTWPVAVNNRHEIVGRAQRSEGAAVEPVYFSSPTGTIEYLTTLGKGYSAAWDINNLGEVVGESDGRAFFWSRETGTLDLNSLIDPGPGIVLTRALAINDRGSIVAWGNVGAKQYGYLLIRPECAAEKKHVATIEFSNQPDGDGDVTYFFADETLYIRICDVDLMGPQPKARFDVRLDQKGIRPFTFELAPASGGCFEGQTPLSSFKPGVVEIAVEAKHTAGHELKRKSELHILPSP